MVKAKKTDAGASLVKNPANEGKTGLIPDPRRSHMLWSN